jgi:hypothetical protein
MFTRLTALRTSEKEMDTRAQIESLRSMTTGQLRDKYAEVFGEDALRLCEGKIALSARGGCVRVIPV